MWCSYSFSLALEWNLQTFLCCVCCKLLVLSIASASYVCCLMGLFPWPRNVIFLSIEQKRVFCRCILWIPRRKTFLNELVIVHPFKHDMGNIYQWAFSWFRFLKNQTRFEMNFFRYCCRKQEFLNAVGLALGTTGYLQNIRHPFSCRVHEL